MFLLFALNEAVDEVEENLHGGVGLVHITKGNLERIEIPLPPMEVQKEIVAEIEGYQKVIDGARAVLDNYRPHIPIHSDWPIVRLGDICKTITDGDHQPPPKASDGIPFITISSINEDHEVDFSKTFFVPESYYAKLNDSRKPQTGDVLYTVTGSYGIPVPVKPNSKFCFQRHIALIRSGPQLLPEFLYFLLASPFMLRQGYDLAQSLFTHQRNLVLEGLTDLWYIDGTAQLLRDAQKAELNDKIALIPAQSAGKVAYFATILHANKLKVAALLDSDTAGDQPLHIGPARLPRIVIGCDSRPGGTNLRRNVSKVPSLGWPWTGSAG